MGAEGYACEQLRSAGQPGQDKGQDPGDPAATRDPAALDSSGQQ